LETAKTLRDLPLRSIPMVHPQDSLEDALARMNDDPLQTVALVDDGMFLGVFDGEAATSGRVPRDLDAASLSVGPYGHRPRVVAQSDTPVAEALHALNRRHQEVLPVVQGVRYRGVITRDDLQKTVATADSDAAPRGADGRGGDVEVAGY
jgi:CBS domain-containing protein